MNRIDLTIRSIGLVGSVLYGSGLDGALVSPREKKRKRKKFKSEHIKLELN